MYCGRFVKHIQNTHRRFVPLLVGWIIECANSVCSWLFPHKLSFNCLPTNTHVAPAIARPVQLVNYIIRTKVNYDILVGVQVKARWYCAQESDLWPMTTTMNGQ